jgi:predicted dehydrogenase
MNHPLPVAVIGAGHMGRHHVRKYHEMDTTELVAVIDSNLDRARELAEPLGVKYAESYSPDLGEIVAATVAVPTVAHLSVAKPLIESGISVLIEKPLTPTIEEGLEVAELAKKHDVTVSVGHTERFNPAVQAVHPVGTTTQVHRNASHQPVHVPLGRCQRGFRHDDPRHRCDAAPDAGRAGPSG